jgi:ubiquinol-cytochrome c reductase iron-sulfur subunit
MNDTDAHDGPPTDDDPAAGQPDPAAGHGETAPGEFPAGGRRRRVIGTPPPAEERTLLSAGDGNGSRPAPRELPADPDDLRHAKNAERVVAALFILATLAGIGFIAAYVGLEVHSVDAVLRSNLALGTSMAVAFLAMAVGFTIWVRHLMPDVELTEERHPLASEPEDRQAFAETFAEGVDASQFVKRPLLRRTLLAATVPLAAAPLVLLRDMGPLPGTYLRHTVWRKGMRLLEYATNRPLTPGDFSSPGSMITVIPDGYQDDPDALAAATAIIIKFRPGELQPPTIFHKSGFSWTVDNIVCYSKICTHVGCPVALYEQTTHRILCPCHQSTFNAPRGALVIFGPAPRPLPQLPIGTDAEGYLIAQGDFEEPVGPSFWERG